MFKYLIKNNFCINACAEQNICLIQDFVDLYKSEDMKQNVMLVACNRKKLKKDLNKPQLNSKAIHIFQNDKLKCSV